MDSAVKFPLVSSSYTGLGNDSSSDDGSSQEPAGFSICRVMLLNTLSGKKCGTLKSPAKMQFKLEYFSRSCLMISCIPSNKTFVSNNCTSIRRGLWWAGFAVRWTAPIMIAWGRTSSCPTHVRMTNRTMLLFVAYLSRCCLLKLPSKRDRHGVNLVVLSSKSVALLSSNFELLQNTATPDPRINPGVHTEVSSSFEEELDLVVIYQHFNFLQHHYMRFSNPHFSQNACPSGMPVGLFGTQVVPWRRKHVPTEQPKLGLNFFLQPKFCWGCRNEMPSRPKSLGRSVHGNCRKHVPSKNDPYQSWRQAVKSGPHLATTARQHAPTNAALPAAVLNNVVATCFQFPENVPPGDGKTKKYYL